MSWILAWFTGYYLLIGVIILLGLRRLPRQRSTLSQPPPAVSVVVAARNEEANIQACLESLLNQDYPHDRYEVIAIDDRSTDRTGEFMREMARQTPNLRVLTGDSERVPGLTGKQRALTLAYDHCQGEFILNTDADCVAPRSWIRSMVSHFHPDVGLVIGIPVCHAPGHPASLFTRLQSLDLVHLLGYAAGAAGWGRTTSCIGNNLAYRRRATDELGGLTGLPDSVTEDLVLAQAIEYETEWKVNTALEPEALMLTQPALGLRDFYRQRKRWLVGGMQRKRIEILFLGLLFLFHVLLLVAPALLSALDGSGWKAWTLAWSVKVAVDGAVCYTMCRRLGRRDLLKLLLPYEGFLLSYSVVVGFGALLRPRVTWKDQQYSPGSRSFG